MDKTHAVDGEIIQSILSGKTDEFAILIDRYKDSVAAVCMNMLKDANDAEEIGHKTFIRLYKSLKKFRGDSSLKTYVCTIASNLCINELNRKSKWYQRFAGIGNQQLEMPATSQEHANDEKEILDFALDLLEPNDKLIIVLRKINEYSTKETAQIMGIKEGTVMSKLSRALKKLRSKLEEIGYKYGK